MVEPHPIPTDYRFKDLTGQKFGRLLVLYYTGKKGHNKTWLCRCDCGNERVVHGMSLVGGTTVSCGCYFRERVSTHRDSSSPEYKTWTRMKKRCFNKASKDFCLYGGRGITVCDRWTNSYEAFLQDMGRRPSPNHSIERRDVHGDYCPENCYWATDAEQAVNTRRNHRLNYQGITQTISQWARQTGIGQCTLVMRIRHGWSVERALTEPVSFVPRKTARRDDDTGRFTQC